MLYIRRGSPHQKSTDCVQGIIIIFYDEKFSAFLHTRHFIINFVLHLATVKDHSIVTFCSNYQLLILILISHQCIAFSYCMNDFRLQAVLQKGTYLINFKVDGGFRQGKGKKAYKKVGIEMLLLHWQPATMATVVWSKHFVLLTPDNSPE